MKILVTGANGQVGYCLQQQLREQGWDFVALTRTELDISDSVAVNSAVAQYQPDIIINAAAYTAVDKAEQEQALAYAINRDGPANLARAAKDNGAAILHISTDYVFAGDATGTYSENDPTAPQGVYGKSKLEGEEAVAAINDKHIILRTAWVFGEHGNNFVKTMIRLGNSRDTLGIVADQEGGPTYAGDIANALLSIAKHYATGNTTPWGTYHYAGLPHISWFGFAQHIFAQVEKAALYNKAIPQLNAITTADYPTPAKRPANSKLDCSKLENAFGIAPSDWQSALKNISTYNS
ncbi:dTDP-4-dehydrorhamnose reductase [Cellvibrio mixtus]|uniref:dTDP-4-dehydrorhamnose reductase n=1 Tax=Cellvibrio mixtus TaxID=39650 RepID=A0A266QCS6_9GAMM|nr:dTDP-4-dehydrorhamnose reductase [Cellvibrio mixtus]OZY87683.1 dTDP-4-dehydrorhamnose reductase [Cellvibrio mixtus]